MLYQLSYLATVPVRRSNDPIGTSILSRQPPGRQAPPNGSERLPSAPIGTHRLLSAPIGRAGGPTTAARLLLQPASHPHLLVVLTRPPGLLAQPGDDGPRGHAERNQGVAGAHGVDREVEAHRRIVALDLELGANRELAERPRGEAHRQRAEQASDIQSADRHRRDYDSSMLASGAPLLHLVRRGAPARTLWLGLGLILAAASFPAAAHGFSVTTELEIAHTARRLAPPDLARQIERNPELFRLGVTTAAADPDLRRHQQNPDGSGQLAAVIRVETQAAVDCVTGRRPFSELPFRLGVLAHYIARTNDPLSVAEADPREGRYAADYRRYVETATPRFAVVFYGLDPTLDDNGGLELFVRGAIHRSRGLYPAIGREYGRIAFASGVGRFDDRSTAFGVGALAFSHAVTDVALVFRHIWLRGGGADDRTPLLASGRMFLVPRAR